ncbi:mechanosensitive ion channel family protein [Staphylothermus hellenicus]|uniref:MscS Mechanosensitive ion channel n=1 Tax=Staphylothermus hellenicus (strain DSM 12710 / JCM 10830 / BK20S6-10-b1 / P8) TaxID=591019 RepID=D7D7X4_STAHD|nr:mechanosensitive ion channel family protein [Staphylothermus hellenicus]ADI31870.1 MscS Mechanosensitive ion channel [Staphylothermus hellenicus DSM 12710]
MGVEDIFVSPLPFLGFSIYQLVVFIVALIIGIIIVRIVANILKRTMDRLKTPPLVSGLVINIIKAIGYIIVILSVLPIIGIDTSAAGLGLSAVIGLILGFGLQDTWANMAAGVWLAVIRPFDKGDYVQVAGYSGIIHGIGVMSTTLKTFENVVITIPNKNIWGAPIVNYTREDTRRVDLDVGVAYGTDLDKAINVALETVKKHPKVLQDPAPQVVVTQLADSSVNLQIRAWTKTSDYGAVKVDLTKMIYEEFNKAGIEIPFPQLDVHIRDMPK